MKPLNLFFALSVVLGFFSCAKKADVFNRVAVNDVKMISFGFYKEDNPSVLLKDYVITQVNTKNIEISLPDIADKSKLVARYTVGNNDAVKVNGILQESGKTANNFTVPVDYFLSDGNNNARYTVTIGKGGGYIWTTIPFTYNDSAVSLILKVNPISNNPYIMYNQSRTNSADQKAGMVAYENNIWVNKGDISDGRVASTMDFTFDNTGVPYASYVDYAATIAQAASIKKYNGSTWDILGTKGITAAKVTYNTLAFTGDNSTLCSFTMLDAAGGGLLKRELDISYFNNGSWSTSNKMPGRSSSLYAYFLPAKRVGTATYVGVFNASSPNSISVYKYENSSWTTLVDQWRDASATAMNIRDFDMDVDLAGNVYVAFVDNSNAALYKYRVIKYTAATQAVTIVGSYITGASGNLFSFDLALSPLGVPYLFYRNSSNYPTIVSLDATTQDWTTPYIFENTVADELCMDFAPNGEAYVAYLKNKKFYVFKYTAP
jgi:hypothetical protein